MKQGNNKKIKLIFHRTLLSQSGASLTMGSVAAFLRKYGQDVDLCFLEKQDIHAVEKILKDRKKFNIIIAKPNFKDYEELFFVLSGLKKYKKIDKVFLCGPYACLNSENLMNDHDWLDGVVTGAIEETLMDLISSISDDCRLFNIYCSGGIWRHPVTGIINSNKMRNATISLNELPFPARDIEAIENVKYVNIEASRGCSFGCSFCHNPIMVGFNNKKGMVDIRDSKLVVDEIEFLNKSFGKTLFIFNDDCFWRGPIDNDRILKFCSELKKRRLSIKFYVYLRCKPFIDEEVLSELVSVGLVRVFLGLENASSKSQALFNKKIEEDSYSHIRKVLEGYNIDIHIGYIVFEPYSTNKDILMNINYLYKIKMLFRLGTILEPVRIVPGSGLYFKLQKDGLLSKNLKFKQITYGYKFVHFDANKLLKKFKNIFHKILYPLTYEYEYYCTTLKLLESLLKRGENTYLDIVNIDIDEFNAIRDKSMKVLLKYFKNVVYFNKIGDLKSLKKIDDNFIDEFRGVFYEIKIKHADIITKVIESGGQNIIQEIYTGQDRI